MKSGSERPPSLREGDSFLFISRSPEDTRLLGAEIAKYSYPGLVVCLTGGLGTGKTEFVRGFAAACGWENARSPSFTIINEYQAETPIAHVDLYRLEEPSGEEFHLEEYARDGYILIVEWADHLGPVSDHGHWKIDLSCLEGAFPAHPIEENQRMIKLSCCGKRACRRFWEFISGTLIELERMRS